MTAPDSKRSAAIFGKAATYLVLAVVAIGVAIPAAIATGAGGDAGMFAECFGASCDQESTLALLEK